MDWKNFLKEILLIIRNVEDQAISDKVKDCLQIHIYLPDLKEERPQLVFENGNIYQITSYDILLRLNYSQYIYSKHITKDITKEYLLNGLKNAENNNDKFIITLKEEIFLKNNYYNIVFAFKILYKRFNKVCL